MASARRSLFDTRYDQMFPIFDPVEIGRLRRFGEALAFSEGERLVTSGQVSPGMFLVVTGEVAVTQHSVLGRDQLIVSHRAGSIVGELAQLAGQPSLADAHATKPVEAVVIPSRKLRELLVREAELGERIMRALILRRVGLLESGIGGPVIVGRAGSADVLRLAGFLSRNGHPHHELDPDTDESARTLIEGFQLIPSSCRWCSARTATCCATRARSNSRGVSGSSTPSIRATSMTSPSSAPVPQGSPLPCTVRRKVCPSSCSTPAPSGDRRAPRRGSRTTSGSRPASAGWRSWPAPTIRRRSSAPRWRSRTRWWGSIERTAAMCPRTRSASPTASGSGLAPW